jgi:cell division protein FtsQ
LVTRGYPIVRLSALSALGLLGVAAAILWSPLFGVRTLAVSGSGHLSRQEVIRLTGLARGDRSFLVDENRVEAALSADPWIARAEVRTQLPSTVRIRIVESKPTAVLRQEGGFALLGADGSILGEVAESKGLPVIETYGYRPTGRMRDAGVAVLASLEPRIARGVELVMVSGTTPRVSVRLTGGIRVDFGPPDELEAKSRALGPLLRYSERNGIQAAVVDLQAPEAPALRPAAAAS